MSRTGRLQEGEGEDGVPPAPMAGGGAPGKRTRVESAMARMGGAPSAQAHEGGAHGDTQAPPRQGRTAQQQLDREAGLANRGHWGAGAALPGFPAPDGSTPQQRHDAAAARLQLIEDSVGHEDVTADQDASRQRGQTKDDAVDGRHSVAAQLAASGTRQPALDARAASAAAASTGQAAPVATFERAVRAYQDAYERTYLVSTDRPLDRTQTWAPTDWRDRLSNRTSALARLREWVAQPYIKFVVPAGHPNDVYIGIEPHGHVDIAEDNALTAGILRVREVRGQLRVSELGNSSGGYRPGPLRNAIVLSRLIDAGLVQDDLSGTDVDNRPDGSYVGSTIRTE